MTCRETGPAPRILRRAAAPIFLLLAIGPAPASAAPARVERPESQLILLGVSIESSPLNVTLPAYEDSGRVWIPVGLLARALDLALEPDLATGIVTGSMGEPARRFDLDLAAGTMSVAGLVRPLTRGAVELHRDDLYMDTREIGRWLPLDLDVDSRAALLTVRPREPLPSQLRQERIERAPRTVAMAGETEAAGPARAAPYRAVAWPSSDHLLELSHQPAAFGASPSIRYSLDAIGDLLWMESRTLTQVDDRRGVTDFHFTLRRANPEPVLLGALHAREVALGDVFDPGLELFTIPRAGRGALLTSVAAAPSEEFGRQSLEGPLPAGWDVELLRNGDLVGYQSAGSSISYRFTNVPLFYGLNEFTLVFHGPQGQSRTETRALNLATSLAPRGSVLYRALVYGAPGEPARAAAELSTGIAARMSATLRMLAPDLDHRTSPYAGVGLRFARDRWFAKTDVAIDSARGSIVETGLATSLGPLGIWAEWAGLDRFRSEVFQPTLGLIRDRATVRLDTRVRAGRLPRVPMSLEWRRDRFETGAAGDRFTHFMAGSLPGLGFSHRLEVRSGLDPGARRTESRGTLLVSHGGRGVLMRGELGYALGVSPVPNTLALVLETWLVPGARLELGVHRGFAPGGSTAHLGLIRTTGSFGVNLRSDYDPVRGAAASLIFSMSLSRDPREGTWYSSALPRAATGAASATVFLDQNGNGLRDPGEPPLPDVALRADPPGLEVQTNARGAAYLGGLPEGQAARLRLSPGALADPMWSPESTEISILSRAGSTVFADFPVLPGGEISGVISMTDENGVSHPAAAILLELLEVPGGGVARSARSAFDGYYDLPALKPGRYRLRVTPPASMLERCAPITLDFEVPARGAVFEGVNLALHPSAAPPSQTSQK